MEKSPQNESTGALLNRQPAADADVWSPALVMQKALHGIVALGARQMVAQALNILGAIFLARLLTPGQFGVYAIIVFLRTFLLAFGDAGLGASLIREPQEPEERDYQAIFTFQQLLVLVVFVAFWIASPLAARMYHLRHEDVWVFRLVALSILASSFQVIPAIRMERHLAFRRLAAVEIVMAVVFNGVAVGLAWKGWGETSFALALLTRSLLGAVLAHLVYPWRIRWAWQWGRIKARLSFGLPYQGTAFTALLKESIGPIYIGLLLGAAQMGYVNWANMVAMYPLLVLTIFQRVYMPAFSRVQDNPQALSKFVEWVVQACNGVIAPFAIFTLVFSGPITRLIFGSKWLGALPLFYCFWVANLFVPTSTPLIPLLNALGRSDTNFLFALVWMGGTWALGAPFVWLWGTIGYGIAVIGVLLTNFWFFRVAQKEVHFKILRRIAPLWCWAAVLGAGAYTTKRWLPPLSLEDLVFHAVIYMVIYLGGALALYSSQVRQAWKLMWKSA